jgi:hypothetical protein
MLTYPCQRDELAGCTKNLGLDNMTYFYFKFRKLFRAQEAGPSSPVMTFPSGPGHRQVLFSRQLFAFKVQK